MEHLNTWAEGYDTGYHDGELHANGVDASNATPNVVVADPRVRRIVNAVLSSVGIVLFGTIAVDLAAPAFDLSSYTTPVFAGYAALSGLFGFAVVNANIPKS